MYKRPLKTIYVTALSTLFILYGVSSNAIESGAICTDSIDNIKPIYISTGKESDAREASFGHPLHQNNVAGQLSFKVDTAKCTSDECPVVLSDGSNNRIAELIVLKGKTKVCRSFRYKVFGNNTRTNFVYVTFIYPKETQENKAKHLIVSIAYNIKKGKINDKGVFTDFGLIESPFFSASIDKKSVPGGIDILFVELTPNLQP